jgi:hypothetical protein
MENEKILSFVSVPGIFIDSRNILEYLADDPFRSLVQEKSFFEGKRRLKGHVNKVRKM